MKKYLQVVVGVVIGALFFYFTLKNQSLDTIYAQLSQANIGWVLGTPIVLFFIFIFRGLRWHLMVKNIGIEATKGRIIYYTIIGAFFNSFTPKFGEIIRCSSLAKEKDIPMAKVLGSVIMERVYDLVVLGLGLLVIGLLEIKKLGSIFRAAYDSITSLITKNWQTLALGVVVFILVIFLCLFIAKKLKVFEKLKNFIKETLTSIKKSIAMKEYGLFLLYTFMIWFLSAVMNYQFLKALPLTQDSTFYFSVVAMFIGVVGWALPSPGGLGTTNFVIFNLFLAYGLNTDGGNAFGILSNLTVFYMLGIGFAALLINFFYKKKIDKLEENRVKNN